MRTQVRVSAEGQRAMYRSALDGLAERVTALEEEKRRLEEDLRAVRRIRRPQRALRVLLGLLLLAAAGGVGAALGYRRAAVTLREVAQEDARVAVGRLDVCNERLRELLAEMDGRDDAPR